MSLDRLCDDLIRGIEACIALKHEPTKRFAPYGAVNSLFCDRQNELRELLRHLFDLHSIISFRLDRYVDRTLGVDNQRSGLCNILATLLYMRGGESILRQFDTFLRSNDSNPSCTDDDLPFDLETCHRLFPAGGRGGDFFTLQFQFCPVVLNKHQDVICKDHKVSCPLPFIQEEYINSGAFGTVYKVLIEKGHFRHGAAGYDSRVPYARKEFELDLRRGEKAFREEMETIQEILQQSKSHKNIMVTQCSLQYGNRFSLFFELAKCNLWEYLSDVRAAAPSTLDQKYAIFHRGVELAGALAFLHEELTWKSTIRLSCYHLDLKPHNVLVVNCRDGVERWKITDFGMSRVKPVGKAEVPPPGLSRTSTFGDIDLGRHFRRKTPPINSTTALASTENRRGEGTYLAPETVIGDGRVSAESDIWSFGCVFSLVITFIGSGPSGVLHFDDFRRHPGGNHFFELNQELDQAKINPRVLEWFTKLCSGASQLNYFECQFIPLSSSSSSDISPSIDTPPIRQHAVAPLQHLAISPDSALVACAVKAKNPQNLNGSEASSTEVYLFRMQDVLSSAGELSLSPVPTLDPPNSPQRSSSSMSHFSAFSPPPWKNIIREGNIGPIAGVRGMKFSKDGSFLALATEPSPSVDSEGNPVLKVTVTLWSTQDGRLLTSFDINNPGRQDLTSSFLTTYSLFNTHPEFLVISQRNSIYHRSQTQKVSGRMNLRLYDALLTEDDEGVILLGDNGTQKILNIYTLPTANIERSEDASRYRKIDLTSYEPTTDSMCLSTHQGRKEILVATRKKTLIAIPAP
ncbi:kinase-like protein [Glonium stellatum]|uniref:non-specific serine/threonine protein kinase n=1 Tax=Glonium stellatum TaxID=574774 RepID=A0A8E2JPL9_9PEZI|nr:kinase-like protein [Glonium stellatum]